MACDTTIDLQTPIGRERVRGFQPPWRTVFVYRCPGCQQETRMFANSYIGFRRTRRGTLALGRPVPSVGGIRCGREKGE